MPLNIVFNIGLNDCHFPQKNMGNDNTSYYLLDNKDMGNGLNITIQ